MAYLPFAPLPAQAPPPGGPAGFAVAPEPRQLIGFAAADPADTRRQLAGLVAALRSAELHATELLDDFPASYHGDYAEMLAALADIDLDDTAAPAAPDPVTAGGAVLAFEQAVADFCTDLALGDRRHTQGYVTAGGAEGLLVGLRAGRDALPGAPLYVSAAVHHAARCHAEQLGMDVVEVPHGADGTMDTEALRLLTAERPGGAVVLATLAGAAAEGADDDLAAIRAAAAPAGPVHVHVDAGDTGLLAPFSPLPLAWDLRDGADSLSLTAHRLLGLPVPCGVVLVGTARTRASRGRGSTPNPLAVALLWAALRERGYDGLRALVHECYDTAGYAAQHLAEAGYRPTRAGRGLTLRFPRPAAAVCTRWRLDTDGPHARLTVLPPLTRATVDALCRDLGTGTALPAGPSHRPVPGGSRTAAVAASQRDG
ncbi:PLP-dependent aminotransferase family protein [Actinacidiphila bryophytorum]|uniref:pyridoxal-dependent decarboxylase n=1 Tax=Actinacidiphila bryophytorum TaxID=1436133 RepID=UPI002176B69E|nr:pyridoxal-dependent decarboxylase [Actinacidiphila bryophytorum]UWE12990.1 pyridoxal-dependent decarboxylase [Actinacidiphila bryophytorum]